MNSGYADTRVSSTPQRGLGQPGPGVPGAFAPRLCTAALSARALLCTSGVIPALTKADWYRAAREIYAAAMAADPEFTEEVTIAVTGGAVFAWDYLTLAQLRQLHRHLFATARSV